MICPCKSCELKGCGPQHSKCKAYQDWKKEHEDEKEWMRKQKPQTSEALRKREIEKVRRMARYGNRGKWGKGGDS